MVGDDDPPFHDHAARFERPLKETFGKVDKLVSEADLLIPGQVVSQQAGGDLVEAVADLAEHCQQLVICVCHGSTPSRASHIGLAQDHDHGAKGVTIKEYPLSRCRAGCRPIFVAHSRLHYYHPSIPSPALGALGGVFSSGALSHHPVQRRGSRASPVP